MRYSGRFVTGRWACSHVTRVDRQWRGQTLLIKIRLSSTCKSNNIWAIGKMREYKRMNKRKTILAVITNNVYKKPFKTRPFQN